MMLVLVGIGCGMGAVLRHYLSGYAARKLGSSLPWGTMLVNVLGALAIGLIYALEQPTGGDATTLTHGFLVIGVLGGFTTVSSLSLQTIGLAQGGAINRAIVNILLTLTLGLSAVYLGMQIGTAIQ